MSLMRRDLGVKTFQHAGPLVNAFPKNQLTGYSIWNSHVYHYLFQKTDINFTVLYALDGYDEISLTGPTKAFSQNSERVLTPQDFGVLPLQAAEIAGGDSVDSSAKIFMNVIQNQGTQAQEQVVCANAGMAIATALQLSPIEGCEKAKESLASGKALEALKQLQNLSRVWVF